MCEPIWHASASLFRFVHCVDRFSAFVVMQTCYVLTTHASCMALTNQTMSKTPYLSGLTRPNTSCSSHDTILVRCVHQTQAVVRHYLSYAQAPLISLYIRDILSEIIFRSQATLTFARGYMYLCASNKDGSKAIAQPENSI